MLRFAILEHDHPFLHWDLLLESGERLRAWRLLSPPDGSSPEIAAVPLAAHRPIYLDYEGPVSGNRGHVFRWDCGTYELSDEKEGHLDFTLQGERIHGRVQLFASDQGWVFRLSGS